MGSLLPALPLLIALAGALASVAIGERGGRRLIAVGALAQGAFAATAIAALVAVREGGIRVHRPGGWGAPVGIVLAVDPLSAIVLALAAAIFAAATAWTLLEDEPASRAPGHPGAEGGRGEPSPEGPFPGAEGGGEEAPAAGGRGGPGRGRHPPPERLLAPSPPRGRVLALVFLLQAGVAGAVTTGDLFDFYVFFELMGLASYTLVSYRAGRREIEASLKYATLSLLGSTFLLLGVGAIYAQSGVLTLAALYEASQAPASPPLYLLAVGLVLVGLGLKAALVPLHFWLPDAHSMAPTAISVLLSGMVVKVGAYGVIRLLSAHAEWIAEAAGRVIVPAAALTAVLAALAAVPQGDVKRLLAWSTASQMGYVLAAGALGRASGLAAAIVYIVAHALTKATLFLMAGAASHAAGHREWKRMGPRLRDSPALAAAGLVACLSLAGIPPLAGFAGKLAVFSAMAEAGAWATLTALVIASALMVYLMGRLWLGLFAGPPEGEGGEEKEEREPAHPGRGLVAVVVAMAALVGAVGVLAQPLIRLAWVAAAGLEDGTAYRAAVLAPAAGPGVRP